ncbi:hypothetical protein FIBSPDRAFT_101243 [Athelia psychrophila]|uniref:Uncharacterized protein n=1 Tax=Athelia psychrophila TaxID=1759441 RepID=A0A166DKB3_9AGAM|nr:hypothetical protein FIBSPDRAFT_101243 [Fibularhizoctonia sp. CBS 109695]
MMDQSGGEYDIVSWDIRGVNDTAPQVSCFDSQESADEFWAGSLWYEGVRKNDINRFRPTHAHCNTKRSKRTRR